MHFSFTVSFGCWLYEKAFPVYPRVVLHLSLYSFCCLKNILVAQKKILLAWPSEVPASWIKEIKEWATYKYCFLLELIRKRTQSQTKLCPTVSVEYEARASPPGFWPPAFMSFLQRLKKTTGSRPHYSFVSWWFSRLLAFQMCYCCRLLNFWSNMV